MSRHVSGPGPGDGCALAVVLPTSLTAGRATDLRRAAQLAEELDFHSAWVGDHLVFHQPFVEAVVALSVAAGATERLRLGFGVLQAGLRHPVWTAKTVNSLAFASGGRVLLGLGTGGDFDEEWRAVGAVTRNRGSLLDETLDMLPTLLRGSRLEHHGRHFHLSVPPLLPVPPIPPPIWIGGMSSQALRRAANHDGWIGFLCSPRSFGQKVQELAAHARAANRRPPTAGIALTVAVCGEATRARRRCADYLQASYRLPGDVAERWSIGGIAQLREVVGEYRQAGAQLVQLCTVEEPEAAWPTVREKVELV